MNNEEEIEKLITDNISLAYFFANKFFKKYKDFLSFDEILSDSFLGLIKAANSFNVDKKVKFATFASTCIRNEVLMNLRTLEKTKLNKKDLVVISLDSEIINTREKKSLSLYNIIEDEKSKYELEKIEDENISDYLLSFINYIKNSKRISKDSKKNFIQIIYFSLQNDGYLKQKELGKLMNVSQSYISRIRKNLYKEYLHWKENYYT